MTNSNLQISRLSTSDADFQQQLNKLLQREMLIADDITSAVSSILLDVKQRGDEAVIDYTNKFDGFNAQSIEDLVISAEQLNEALERLPASQRRALTHAAERIRTYHEKQKQGSWQYEEADGSVYGQKVSPLEKAGVYVPGGKANYPSSVLMLAIPAQVAGVKEIIATVPTPYGEDGNLVFAAAALAGVSRLYTIGGAQAIAALAYGTETIPQVDKITGPGNVYVTVAKKMVFGEVGIDMVAGPSELTIICDGKTDPDWIAMDLFSQAEHDEQAQSILISPDEEYLDSVAASIRKLLPEMERREIIAASLASRGMLIHAIDLVDAARVSDLIAPEHLEISVADPESLLSRINHAGAIFLGRHSAEALGDYCAGPSHVLPTSGTARFFSALGVYDFQKRSSIINCSYAGAHRLAETAAELARNEHLQAHALSAEYRIDKELKE
ncbi:MAG: histidinol dehydrogenase [Gammaproteobacteria bacterium]|nr:histidinol dehydrogenase [Gammaproteobacteria bacterium]MDD9896591.1 histidinol dehydrogenase [Gammaproteobacteria bacterium]MDD9960280.1 histidinol dehydrogenase [Gammaproteobacteria bacterium]